jgi:hypothetical protein
MILPGSIHGSGDSLSMYCFEDLGPWIIQQEFKNYIYNIWEWKSVLMPMPGQQLWADHALCASVKISTSWLRANRTMHPSSNCISRGDCLGESNILFKWVVSVNNWVHLCIAWPLPKAGLKKCAMTRHEYTISSLGPLGWKNMQMCDHPGLGCTHSMEPSHH